MIAIAIVAAACGPSDPLQVATIQVGRSLNSDDSVGNITTTFKPNETIYAAVLTDAAGSGTIEARWLYAGQTVSQESKEVRMMREGATEFHIQPPSNGFPEGDYRVEFQLDGQPIGSREFRVVR